MKYTESRSESMLAAHHGRDQIQHLTLAAKRDGTVTGIKVDLLADMGAYLRLVTSGIPILGAFMYNGIYKFAAYRFTCTNVFTNKTPTDAYRGAGRPEATFAIERMMDELATKLQMDPLELREKNWIKHQEFPYDTVCGLTYDSGNYEAATAKAKELFGYDGLRREQAERRERADTTQLGIGVSTFTEMCGLAPSRVLGSLAYGAGGWEHASIRVLPTGKVEVVTGASAHGQGHETAFSQIVADQLGVAFEDIEVLHGDTLSSARGLDTYGSRSLAVGGIAIVKAAEKVIAKARPIAAHLMEAAEDDLEFAAGKFRPRHGEGGGSGRHRDRGVHCGGPARRDRTQPRLRGHLRSGKLLLPARHAPVRGRGGHRDGRGRDPQVRLRRRRRPRGQPDDRGGPDARRTRAGHRAGALRGRRLRRVGHHAVGSFAEYLVPGAPDLPTFVTDRTETPATGNPLGVKGVGESGTIASTPAVVNAVVDAVRHLGVRDIVMPCSPMRVWKALVRHREVGSDPVDFDYVAPTTLDEAVAALAAAGEDAKVLGGGQSLMPVLRLRLAAPTSVVDLGRIAELRGVREDGDTLVIGAMTTHADVATTRLVAAHAPLLSAAAATIGDRRSVTAARRRLDRARRPGR